VFPRLHIVTDSLDVVRAAVGQGPVAVQIRVKSSDRLAYQLTLAALPLCRAAGAMCLVDDRVGVALATGADGVHVGADDLPVAVVRQILGPGAVIGATCRTPADGRAVVEHGASYLGVGPAYATSTKDGLPAPLGPAGIAAMVEAVPGTPVIAIGGITPARVAALAGHGVAVVSAIAADPAGATRAFLTALRDRAERRAPAGVAVGGSAVSGPGAGRAAGDGGVPGSAPEGAR
jgi:thiamine-phosphate pyrophosphorylase